MLIILRKISALFLLFFCFSFISYAADEPDVSADSAILIDGDTLEILYEKNSESQRSMASTTKIMTSIIAIESGLLDKTVTVKEKPYIEGTAIGFNKGDKLTLEALCYAMLLESGNDAAILTADFLAGSEEDFSKIMNRKAEEIGMQNTNFVTASGLDAPEHYTTAYDMALLGAYAVENDKFREICSSKSYKAEFIKPGTTRYFSNHNRLLTSCDGVIGIKTGFTKKSGRCLVSACERNGKRLVAVTLNAPDDWNDHSKLYNYGYSLYENINVNFGILDNISVYGSDKTHIKINALTDNSIFSLKGSNISTVIQLKKILYAPIVKNEVIGKLIVLQNGTPIAEHYISACESADIISNYKIYKPTLFRRIINSIKNIKMKG